MNRFAHKHIGQLKECCAWSKHEGPCRKHAWRRILDCDGNRLQKLLISLLFYVFLVLTVHPSLFPVSLVHSLFPSSTFLSMLHIFYPPFAINLNFPPPLNFSFFLCLSLSTPPLPDIVARCPMSHTSAKIIRDGRREGVGRNRKKPPGIEQKQESMTEKNTENKNGRGEGRKNGASRERKEHRVHLTF